MLAGLPLPTPVAPMRIARHDPPASPAAWLAALAQPTRLAILAALAGGSKRRVHEVATACGHPMVRVSYNLGLLRKAGIVPGVKDWRRGGTASTAARCGTGSWS